MISFQKARTIKGGLLKYLHSELNSQDERITQIEEYLAAQEQSTVGGDGKD